MEGLSYVMKAVVIGDTTVGKTSICRVLSSKKIAHKNSPTIGVSFSCVRIPTRYGTVKLQMWDLGGHANFKSIMSTYLRGAIVVTCVIDVTRAESLESAKAYIQSLKKENDGLPMPEIVLLANKTDLSRVVSRDDIRELATDLDILYAEGSAKVEPEGVRKVFSLLVERALVRKEEFLMQDNSHLFARSHPYGDLNQPIWGRARKKRWSCCARIFGRE